MRKSTQGRSFGELPPEMATEWADSRFSAFEVTATKQIKVKWRCAAGHEWMQRVSYRHKTACGCPECQKKSSLEKNSFAARYPEHAKFWEYERNHPLTPDQVNCSSGKPVW